MWKKNHAQNYSGRSGLLNMENIINEYSLTISIDEGIEYATLLEEQHIVNGVELKSGAREYWLILLIMGVSFHWLLPVPERELFKF